MKCAILLAAASLVLCAQPALAQDFTITNATVAAGDGSEPVAGATVVVRNGRIASVGREIDPVRSGEIIDGTGMWVTPGIFASITTLGIVDVEAVSDSDDRGAGGSPFSAALDVSPVINPASQGIAVARTGGVTRASVMPIASASIFGGQGAIVDLGADFNAVTRPRAFQVVEMGERGGRLAGGSRTSAHALLRNALREAARYGDDARLTGNTRTGPTRTGDDVPLDPRMTGRAERDSDVLLSRFDAAALVPVVNGQQKLYVKVERAIDILSAIALREDFPKLDMVLVGATEGWMVAERIAAAGVPVITVALRDLPVSFEQMAATQSNVGRMVDAGVTVAIGGYDSRGDLPHGLPQQAGNMVAISRVPGATGLTWGEAFATITSVPARIAGLADTGVLEGGARGDLVLWDGDPLELDSAPVKVWIDGVEQPLGNHRTRLRDRYRDLDESDLPKGYDR
ncbi:amidohydrolase family protein [Qipengyuania sphaerica]|uniref:amidohydrolase family protein n=1 Tax=Qipengyuania sphaerica TaxID=2867243 RepID=UPI001C87C96E|nr:amidohydrolase family protein [Qipengyuania sphaerica]MBX7541626.1 amidohydrolase family protein [Qipengyuania sphaerica]